MVKVDLITGFLGAGKTTFIGYYMKWLQSRGEKVEIIENEFGVASVDTVILNDNGMPSYELAGGCICCSLKVDFALLLVELAGKADRIIVEPSGIFSLDEFFYVMNSPKVREVCETGAVITIVDGLELPAVLGTSLNVLASQLHSTGRILISKTGYMTRAKIEDTLCILLETGKAFSAEQGAEWAAMMEDRIETGEWDKYTDQDFERIAASTPLFFKHDKADIMDHQRLFNSITVYLEKKYGIDSMHRAMEEVMAGGCGQVIRIKGYVGAEDGGSYIVNCTPNRINIKHSAKKFKPMLNIIGTGISRKACQSVLG